MNRFENIMNQCTSYAEQLEMSEKLSLPHRMEIKAHLCHMCKQLIELYNNTLSPLSELANKSAGTYHLEVIIGEFMRMTNQWANEFRINLEENIFRMERKVESSDEGAHMEFERKIFGWDRSLRSKSNEPAKY